MCGLQIAKAGAKPDIRARVRAGVGEVQRAQPGSAGIVATAATVREPFPCERRVESAYRVINTLGSHQCPF